jgi:hypothetical protein
VNDTAGSWKRFDVFHINVVKNQTAFSFVNLYSLYYQNNTANFTTTSNQIIAMKVYTPTGNLILSFTNRTVFPILWNSSGWYRINATFAGNSQFLGYSIETVFEVRPIQRPITRSEDVSMTLNGQSVIGNGIILPNLSSGNIVVSGFAGSIFDLSFTGLLYYSVNITNGQYYLFQFNSTTQISSISIQNMTVTNYNAFDLCYVDGLPTTNYTITNNRLYVIDLTNRTMLNRDTFSITLIDSTSEWMEQIDDPVITPSDQIQFRQFAISTRSFQNWYFDDITSATDVTVRHVATNTMETLVKDGTTYYFSHIGSTTNELYEIIWTINPELTTSYETLFNNGTSVGLKVTVSSIMILRNVSVQFIPTMFYTTWDNAVQNMNTNVLMFNITQLNAGESIFYLYGSRDVPMANYSAFHSETGIVLFPEFDAGITYAGMLAYPDYSEVWSVPIAEGWEIDGIHYGNTTHVIQNNTFFCSGYDSSITSSYLQFRANPLLNFDIIYGTGVIALVINTTLPIDDCLVQFATNFTGNVRITTENVDLLTSVAGIQMYSINQYMDLEAGENIILLSFSEYELADNSWYTIPIVCVVLLGIIWYLWKGKQTYRGSK